MSLITRLRSHCSAEDHNPPESPYGQSSMMAGSSSRHSSPKHTTGSASSQRRGVGNSRKPPQFPHRLSARASNRLCRSVFTRFNRVCGTAPATLKKLVLIRLLLGMLFLLHDRSRSPTRSKKPRLEISAPGVIAAVISCGECASCESSPSLTARDADSQLVHAAALPGSDFKLQFELTRLRSLRRNPRFLPAIGLDGRRLCLIPRQNAVRSGALAQTHGLRAGEPLF